MSVAILRYEAPPAEPPEARVAALQRGHGALTLAFARRGAVTAVSELYQRSPCRVLFPRVEAGEPPLAVLLTTSGGVAGGDEIRWTVTARAGARAGVTAQAAEKIYRSLGPAATIDVALTAEDDAWLEWLPQETILFDGARLERSLNLDLAPTARLLAAEMLVFGRAARGERFGRGLLAERWDIRRDGRLVWTDRMRLDEDSLVALKRGFAFDGASAYATALYVGADAETLLPVARELAEHGRARGAATLIGSVLLARFLAPRAAAVRGHLGRYLAGLRHAACGLPARLPPLWNF